MQVVLVIVIMKQAAIFTCNDKKSYGNIFLFFNIHTAGKTVVFHSCETVRLQLLGLHFYLCQLTMGYNVKVDPSILAPLQITASELSVLNLWLVSKTHIIILIYNNYTYIFIQLAFCQIKWEKNPNKCGGFTQFVIFINPVKWHIHSPFHIHNSYPHTAIFYLL